MRKNGKQLALYTHTHTHTHTHDNLKNKKIVIVLVIIALLIIGVMAISKKTEVLEIINLKIDNIKKSNEIVATMSNSNRENTKVVDISKWDMNVVNIVEDGSNEHVRVPVPKGYVASKADGENIVNAGFVIYEGEEEVTTDNAWEESLKRNQWVWVPVPDPSRVYEIDSQTGKMKSKLYDYKKNNTERTVRTNSKEPAVVTALRGDYNGDTEQQFNRYGAQGMTRDKLLTEIEKEFEETIKSIEKYGGFYIGRYELGNIGEYFRTFVVQRLNDNIGYGPPSWYEIYHKSKYLSANMKVRTNLIYGCLWDETIQWFIDSGSRKYNEIVDSSKWANCNFEEFEYVTKDGNKVYKNIGNDNWIPTGSTERNKTNNIYDMAGNIYDWTMEVDSEGHVDRGGLGIWGKDYFSGVADRCTHGGGSGGFCTARVYMYIK